MENTAQQTAFGLDRFGENKTIPSLLSEEILLALSYFPDLQAVHIDFELHANIRKSVMLAQPRPGSLFRRADRRRYVIKISRFFQVDGPAIPIESVPKNVLIGWIGHELGHIMDYLQRSLPALARYGIGYLFSRKYLMIAERTADLYAISHGLGEKIVATKYFILDHAHLPETYKDRIRRLYVSPKETLRLIEEHHARERSSE
ncbi:hypothetical protein [Arundinibacter roseus]|uniref:Uncharacterized protein n=1 Tax=Arundinibacter roseus TaxID=2070510 RepID=A0A4R4JVU1_9BACT|nr:hypothetical protein [Arundinibacter roseus]TDB58212.1 hypothetical protein EZE20_23115 [Arundinibacter roseus]